VDPLTLFLQFVLPSLIGAGGQMFGAGVQGQAANRATDATTRMKQQELDWQKQATLFGFDAQEEENERRSREAQFRAAKLEDIAKMFENLEGLGGLKGDADKLRGFADQMMQGDDETDLRRAAMGELSRNGGALNAMLAQSRDSGAKLIGLLSRN
jgi:hypothetical protein